MSEFFMTSYNTVSTHQNGLSSQLRQITHISWLISKPFFWIHFIKSEHIVFTCMQGEAQSSLINCAPHQFIPWSVHFPAVRLNPVGSLLGGQWVGFMSRLYVLWLIDVDTRQVLHNHFASSSHGPRVKKHGESWDVITQSVCAILIKTLLTVLHYWNAPHWNLLNSLNKLTPVSLLIHRLMSTFFFFFPSVGRKKMKTPPKKEESSKLRAHDRICPSEEKNIPTPWATVLVYYHTCFAVGFKDSLRKTRESIPRKLWWSFGMRLRSTSSFFPLGFLVVSCVPLICVALMC